MTVGYSTHSVHTTLLNGGGKLPLDVFEVDSGPSFGELGIDKSAALVDIEANFPTCCRYTENLPRLSCFHNHICFYDVVSFKMHSGDKNMFVGNGRIDLTPEHLKPFPSARKPHRFQLVTAAVGGHDAIKPRRVRCEKGLQVAQEVLQELRPWAIGFQNGPDWRAQFESAVLEVLLTWISLRPPTGATGEE